MAPFQNPAVTTSANPPVILSRDKWCFGTTHDFELMPYEIEIRIRHNQNIFITWHGYIDFRDFVGKAHRQRFFFMYSHREKKLLAVGPKGQNAEEVLDNQKERQLACQPAIFRHFPPCPAKLGHHRKVG